MSVHLNELSSVYLDQIVEKKKEKPLDPVGREDGDIDNDGDEDESDSYLANRRKAIGKAMGKKDKQKKGKKDCDEQVEAVDEAKADAGLTPLQKIRKRNKAYAMPGEKAGDQTSNRRSERASARGEKKERGAKKDTHLTLRHVGGPYKADNYARAMSRVEQVEAVDEAKKASLKQARKNIGMDPNKPSCWTGYKAKGTKMKNGRSVPNCVKEGDLVDEAKKSKMKKARENVGASTCWDGYVAKGTKKKNGRDVPNCVKEDELEELYKGKHGQSEKEYQDGRSDAGKMISGDSKTSGAAYSSRGVKNTGPNPAAGKEKPKAQGRMGSKDREYLAYRKARLSKEGFSDWRSELTETLGEGILIEVEKKKSLKNNSEKVTDGPVDNSSIIKINPDFKEGIEYLGGTIVEFTEVSEGEGRKEPTPQQRLNRDAGKMASKKLKQKEHEKYVNFLQHDEEVQWVANTAAEYFVEEGLNEYGIEILIEELGLESFVEYVYELGEEVLTEARAGGVRVEPVTKTGKSVGSLGGGARASAIKRLRKEKRARRDSESGSSKPSGMTAALRSQSDRAKAVDTAKKQQPKKRGLLDRVGDAVAKGIERHNKAMATANKLSSETGKTLKKAGKVAGAVAKGAGEGVKMAGKAAKVAHKVATEENEMNLSFKERLKAVYKVTSPYIVDEGYRVVSKSYKHGDGKPEDDVTIKREKKVVSGDNLTRKGANKSKERRGSEYGNQDAFAVQKTREAKKRPSNAPSADKVKADINKKEKQREKASYNRKIGGMNRAGTPSGKVAAARLKGMKKIDAMEKVEFNHPIDPNQNARKNERDHKIFRAADARVANSDTIARKRGQAIMPSFPNKKKVAEEMSVKDAMAFTIKHNKENPRKEWKPGDREKQRAAQLRNAAKKAKKDNRTDAERMADAYASPRKGPGGQRRVD